MFTPDELLAILADVRRKLGYMEVSTFAVELALVNALANSAKPEAFSLIQRLYPR